LLDSSAIHHTVFPFAWATVNEGGAQNAGDADADFTADSASATPFETLVVEAPALTKEVDAASPNAAMATASPVLRVRNLWLDSDVVPARSCLGTSLFSLVDGG